MALSLWLAVLLSLLPAAAVGQFSYCDSSYQPAVRQCCTALSVLVPPLGQCCLRNNSYCYCVPNLLGPSMWAQCALPSTTTTTTTPTTTTTSTTSTTTTTKPSTTTTVAYRKLCPSVAGRLVGGTPVTDPCYHNGVISIGVRNPTSGVAINFCNAVSTYNHVTGLRELVVIKDCWDTVKLVISNGWIGTATSQNVSFQFDTCGMFTSSTIKNSSVSSYVVAVQHPMFSMYLDSLDAVCDNIACVFDANTMSISLQPNDCFLLSHGSTGLNALQSAYEYKGLTRLNVTITFNANCNYNNSDRSVLCVQLQARTGTCVGDGSAGLFCPLSTGEVVLIGILKFYPSCDGQTTYVPVAISTIVR